MTKQQAEEIVFSKPSFLTDFSRFPISEIHTVMVYYFKILTFRDIEVQRYAHQGLCYAFENLTYLRVFRSTAVSAGFFWPTYLDSASIEKCIIPRLEYLEAVLMVYANMSVEYVAPNKIIFRGPHEKYSMGNSVFY